MGAVVIPFSKDLLILREFEKKGIPLLNSSKSIDLASDQLKTLHALSQAGLPIPKTAVITTEEYTSDRLIGVKNVEDAVKHLRGFPLVFKGLEGSGGENVFFPKDMTALQDLISEFQSKNKPYLLQEFIKGASDEEGRGRDIRVVVVDGKVLGAMERRATTKGELRANKSLGGEVFPYDLSQQQEEIASKVAKAAQLRLAGLDWLFTQNPEDPLLVSEVNALVGKRGFRQATGIDFESYIIQAAARLAEKAKASNIEERQRPFAFSS